MEVMRLRFGDKLRRASKTLDELQQDIFNEVSRMHLRKPRLLWREEMAV